MRIGIFGGTFDPPHVGHLNLAKAAIDGLELDEVLFLPANRNPFKSEASLATAKHRLAMVQRMIEGEPKMAVSDMEITRGGISYTVDTLGELQLVRPADYFFILGADAVKRIEDWRNPQRLLRLCRLAVAMRSPDTEDGIIAGIPEQYRNKVDILNMPPIDVSSSELRRRIGSGINVSHWVSPPVIKYIQDNKLYRG